MNYYIHISTGEYPLTERQIRQRNPLVSFGRPFAPEGYAVVVKESVDYDPNTQKLVPGEVVQAGGQYIEQQTVVPLTAEEFNPRQSNEEISPEALKKILVKQLETMAVPTDEINDYASLFPVFRVGESVTIGARRQYDGEVWEVIQAHTTQIDWLPPVVPALWKRVHSPDVIPEWTQPAGAHDAYNIGDRVMFEGKVYESTIDANVWSPTAYPQGWTEITGE